MKFRSLIFGVLIGVLIFPMMAYSAQFGGIPKYAQTVTVAKSGGKFTSIQSAINSIATSSATSRYCVQVFPGIYTESITMKPYVDLVGVDRDSCIITQADATVVTMASNSTLSHVTVSLSNSTAAREIIKDNGAASSNTYISDIVLNVTGNYAHKGIYLATLAGGTHTNIKVNNVVINSVALMIGIQYGSGNHPQSNCEISRATILGGAVGIKLLGRDTVQRACLLTVNNSYITSTIGVLNQSSSTSYYCDLDLFYSYLSGNITITSLSGTDTVTVNSYGSTIASLVKSAGGGTETFNSYGSVVGSQMQNADGTQALPAYSFASDPDSGLYSSGANSIRLVAGNTVGLTIDSGGIYPALAINSPTLNTPSIGTVATTPAAYALSKSEGTMVYVTSAHKLYVRGAATWEAITSAP